MKIGISSYTYTWALGVPGYENPENRIDLKALLKKAVELEVALVQVCDNLPLHLIDEREIEAAFSFARENNLEIEIGTRGVEEINLKRYLELAELFEAKLVRTIIQGGNGEKIKIEKAISELKKIMPAFEKKGIKLAVENHENYQVRDFIYLLNKLESEAVGICLDTVNSFAALEGPEFVVDQLAPFTVNLHIKDFQIKREKHQMGFNITGAPAGQGMLDVIKTIEAVKENNAQANAILELWTPFTGDVKETICKEHKWAVESIAYLKNII